MKPPADLRRHIWVLAFAVGAVSITALRCSGRLRHVPEPPAVMFELPGDYALVDHLRRPFGPQTMQGKVWVAGFVFTSCPSSCPAVTRAMDELHQRFDRYGVDVEMVSFTVDPEHDTPEVLAAHFSALGVESEHWRFVTGEPAAVLRLVRHGFKLGVGDREADEQGVAYDIAHSTKLALIDGNGGVRGFYSISDEHGTDEIFERAQHVLAEMERGR